MYDPYREAIDDVDVGIGLDALAAGVAAADVVVEPITEEEVMPVVEAGRRTTAWPLAVVDEGDGAIRDAPAGVDDEVPMAAVLDAAVVAAAAADDAVGRIKLEWLAGRWRPLADVETLGDGA